MGKANNPKRDVFQVTFILNLLLVPFGIIILLTGLATKQQIQPFDEFLRGHFHALSVCLVITGFVAIAVGFFGCFGVLRDRFCIILIYPHLLLIIFAFQIVVGGLAFAQRDGKTEIVIPKLNETMFNYTENAKQVDFIQTKLECCGMNDSGDYDKSIPSSCCKNSDCSISFNHYPKGCKNALEDLIHFLGNIISGASLTFAALEISGFIYFIVTCHRMWRRKQYSSAVQKLIEDDSSEEETTHYP